MRAMLPPPAPTSIMSSTGTSRGSPLPRLKRYTRATSDSVVIGNSPPALRKALAVVPPMSKASRSSKPQRLAVSAAARAPPQGPDSTSRTGNSAAVAAVAVPPLERVTCSGAGTPRLRMPSWRLSR